MLPYEEDIDFALIGKSISKARKLREYTQQNIADACGVNVTHISNIETNKVKVSLNLLVKICNVLEVSLDYMLTGNYTREEESNSIKHEIMRQLDNIKDSKELRKVLRVIKALYDEED